MFTVEIPTPPSLNNIYVNKKPRLSKPALDSLVASGRIDDDRNVELVMAHRCREDGRSILIVWSAKEDAYNWQPVGEAAKGVTSRIERVEA